MCPFTIKTRTAGRYEVVVPRKIQDEVKKRLKNRELINRFYRKLQKLETEPSVYGKPLRKPLSNSTLGTQKTAAATRLSPKSQNTED